MNKLKSLLKNLLSKTVTCAVLVGLLTALPALVFAQSAEVKRVGVYYKTGAPSNLKEMYCDVATTSLTERSFVNTPVPQGNQLASTQGDPWVSSALIEYDQPYPSDKPAENSYPNHCLALCMDVYCNNLPLGQSTYSIAFPLQQIRFDIVKYYNNQNIQNKEASPAVHTIDLFPGTETGGNADPRAYKCGSYKCVNGDVKVKDDDTQWPECIGPKYVITSSSTVTTTTCTQSSGPEGVEVNNAYRLSDGASGVKACCNFGNGHTDCIQFNDDGAATHTNTPLKFCAAWDGNYEHSGEMGKSNGNFAFRATVATNTPGDGMIVSGNIEFDSTMAYPAMNQIPIQVDVTNVHTVRSTPYLIGQITKVAAQPYTLVYRLSKDADVRIAIFDGETKDDAIYGTKPTSSGADGAPADDETKPVRLLVDWQPRNGEGIIGDSTDKPVQDFDSWDGRNDSGLLLPAGNYVATIQAKSRDEWGIDFSRAVTRQISLDPLKLTDLRVTGLTKKSTAYATISYVPTESSTVYWEIYTPGTVFGKDGKNDIVDTDSSTATGTGPAVSNNTGTLVYRSEENRTGRMNYTARWDGTCQVAGGCKRTYAKNEKTADGRICGADGGFPLDTGKQVCTQTFAQGSPMPDGNYVYVLWAEVPYNGAYYNLASGVTDAPKFVANGVCAANLNNKCFTGVKTLKYNVGTLEVERGLVGITIEPVSYSTVGSSPTAYGLDPFIFKYALERDAQAVATVQNTAGVVVRYLTPQGGTANVSQQLNTLSWDGRDEQGRMVAPGTYMFVVEAHDAMFPAMKNRATAVFPVDMYRLVDLNTTDVYGDNNAKATISYLLSKAMNVQINIYNKDVVIPNYNSTTGDYNSAGPKSDSVTQEIGMLDGSYPVILNGEEVTIPAGARTPQIQNNGGTYAAPCTATYCDVWTVELRPDTKYNVTLTRVYKNDTTISDAPWPPRVCNKTTDESIFNADGSVNPSLVASNKVACIYVNDPNFKNYPADLDEAADPKKLSVRLQPVKTFERSALKNGDGMLIMEEWDALYFYNPTPSATEHTAAELAACAAAKERTNCPYETVPDGQYPFFISARSNEPFSRYYYDESTDTGNAPSTGTTDPKTYQDVYIVNGAPFTNLADVVQMPYLYATDKQVSKINVTRGPVYFLDGSVAVYPNAPEVFNSSTGPVFIPPYEINFSVSRAAEVEIAIVSLKDNVCSPVSTDYTTGTVNATEGNAHDLYTNNGTEVSTQSAATNANGRQLKTNKAGQICKFLSTMTIADVGNFDANIVRKAYWDGTDHTGHYVTPGIYEVRLTARNYPNNHAYQATVKSVPVNAQLFQVFDLLESDSYAISLRNTDMHVGYQISVPMKVALQIFKPGTTIYDYSKGTLRNPTTGKEVQDIHEVLVRSIVGIRPSMTLIDEIWDGRDYAQQEVPDGTYPFRFVTSINGADIDTMTGEIIPGNDEGKVNSNNAQMNTTASSDWKINYVADTYQYQNLHRATVAIGDGKFVCEDWEKTVFFYPNPLNDKNKGTLEITKMPVPGTLSIKYYNLAGDLVKDSGYECIDANNYVTSMGNSLSFYPDNDPVGSRVLTPEELAGNERNVRNAAMRCKWNAKNQHNKDVARGVYFGLVDFKAKAGREHCQKVVKIIVP